MGIKPKPGRCANCTLDDGWDLSDPDDPKRCDHGHLERAVAAAEAADRDEPESESESVQPWWADK